MRENDEHSNLNLVLVYEMSEKQELKWIQEEFVAE